MQRIIYICDVCGDELRVQDSTLLKIDIRCPAHGITSQLDCCPECWPRVDEFLNNTRTAYDALVRKDPVEE